MENFIIIIIIIIIINQNIKILSSRNAYLHALLRQIGRTYPQFSQSCQPVIAELQIHTRFRIRSCNGPRIIAIRRTKRQTLRSVAMLLLLYIQQKHKGLPSRIREQA
jgi:hypothetical protein